MHDRHWFEPPRAAELNEQLRSQTFQNWSVKIHKRAYADFRFAGVQGWLMHPTLRNPRGSLHIVTSKPEKEDSEYVQDAARAGL